MKAQMNPLMIVVFLILGLIVLLLVSFYTFDSFRGFLGFGRAIVGDVDKPCSEIAQDNTYSVLSSEAKCIELAAGNKWRFVNSKESTTDEVKCCVVLPK